MSEKVIVNKVVAGWIENIKFELATGCKYKEHILLRNLMVDRANQLGGLNIDIVTLAKAIQYGYEVPYEFKAGDIILYRDIWAREIVDDDSEEKVGTQVSLKWVKDHASDYKLICKAEERRDLK